MNPARDSVASVEPVSIETVQESEQHRELLKHYVVAVIDTGTSRGKAVHRLFKSPELPRVVVIDKRQKQQIFQTSRSLDEQQWTTLLETYREGERPAPPARPSSWTTRSNTGFSPGYSGYRMQRSGGYCPTCQ
jgi:hypothetical protein